MKAWENWQIRQLLAMPKNYTHYHITANWRSQMNLFKDYLFNFQNGLSYNVYVVKKKFKDNRYVLHCATAAAVANSAKTKRIFMLLTGREPQMTKMLDCSLNAAFKTTNVCFLLSSIKKTFCEQSHLLGLWVVWFPSRLWTYHRVCPTERGFDQRAWEI